MYGAVEAPARFLLHILVDVLDDVASLEHAAQCAELKAVTPLTEIRLHWHRHLGERHHLVPLEKVVSAQRVLINYWRFRAARLIAARGVQVVKADEWRIRRVAVAHYFHIRAAVLSIQVNAGLHYE